MDCLNYARKCPGVHFSGNFLIKVQIFLHQISFLQTAHVEMKFLDRKDIFCSVLSPLCIWERWSVIYNRKYCSGPIVFQVKHGWCYFKWRCNNISPHNSNTVIMLSLAVWLKIKDIWPNAGIRLHNICPFRWLFEVVKLSVLLWAGEKTRWHVKFRSI